VYGKAVDVAGATGDDGAGAACRFHGGREHGMHDSVSRQLSRLKSVKRYFTCFQRE
jgi:hypothetical protein